MKTTMTSLFAAATMIALTVSCKRDVQTPVIEPPMPPTVDFDYQTTTQIPLRVTVADINGVAINSVSYSAYFENPVSPKDGTLMPDIEPILTSSATKASSADLLLSVPTLYDSIFIIVNSTGFINPTAWAVKDITPSGIKIYPAGYAAATSSQTRASTPLFDFKLLDGNLWQMGGWNSQGKPLYLEAARDVINPSMRATVMGSVPEYKIAPVNHPEFFTNSVSQNINIVEPAEIWVTFLSEGAGYRNLLGYFVYPTNNPPTSAANIDARYIIFPNSSFVGSGGELVEGDKVQLKFYDMASHTYVNRFPDGYSVGWFILPDGFNGQSLPKGTPLYSFKNFNPGSFQQSVLLADEKNSTIYISFEDITLTSSQSDRDFNDVIFYLTSTPYAAISTGNLIKIVEPKDSDGDGVKDPDDAYPNDPTLAYDYYYPAKNVYGSIAYEDLWPSTGDYDFNDLVVDVNVHQMLNAQNRVAKMDNNLRVRAVGGSYHNGFAIALGNVSSSAISSVSGTRLNGNLFSIGSNGTENGTQYAVIPAFDDAYVLFNNAPFINTYPDKPKYAPVDMAVKVNFHSPQTQSALSAAPFDPFMVIKGDRGREVHLINKAPTTLATKSYFGTGKDASNSSTGKYYVSSDGHPWAISTPSSFAYPVEKISIHKAYNKFGAWATSKGSQYTDWYTAKSGYRNSTLIFQ